MLYPVLTVLQLYSRQTRNTEHTHASAGRFYCTLKNYISGRYDKYVRIYRYSRTHPNKTELINWHNTYRWDELTQLHPVIMYLSHLIITDSLIQNTIDFFSWICFSFFPILRFCLSVCLCVCVRTCVWLHNFSTYAGRQQPTVANYYLLAAALL